MGSSLGSTSSDHQQFSQQWKWFLSSCAWAATAEQGCSAPAELDCSAALQYDPCFSSYWLSPKSFVFTCYHLARTLTLANQSPARPSKMKRVQVDVLCTDSNQTQLCNMTPPHAPPPTDSAPKAGVKRVSKSYSFVFTFYHRAQTPTPAKQF